MKILDFVLTAVFGLFWLVFGLNGFAHFFAPPVPTGQAAVFMQALEQAGYVMPLVYGSQLLAGALLLSRRFRALALLILAPVVGNIILYDTFLNHSGLVIGGVIGVFYAALLVLNRKRFLTFLKP